MRLDEAQTGMIRKIKGNRGRATMDEKDYELLHALDETRNITHAADKLYTVSYTHLTLPTICSV